MQRQFEHSIRQRGIRAKSAGYVLVIGMIFLVVLTVAAVALMTGTTQDEKITGNTRRAADAFMAAEGGWKAALDKMWANHQGQDYNPPAWFYYRCDPDTNTLVDNEGNPFTPDGNSAFIKETAFAEGSRFRVLYGGICSATTEGVATEGVARVSMVSEGEQFSDLDGQGASETNAFRRIHFNVNYDGGGSWPAVFVNDDPDDPDCDFDFGPSVSYLYDGRGGPAIATNTQTCADQIREADNDSGQLLGGVVANNPAPDFTSPGGLERFVAALDHKTHASRKIYGTAPNPNKAPVVQKQDLPDLGTPGDPSSMKTTIIYGDLDITGGISGAGILVVTGKADFGGTPHWDGIILVLGGEVDIGGGGTDNGLDGTMLVSNIDFGSSDSDGDGYPGPWDQSDPEWNYTSDSWVTRWDHDPADPVINWETSGGGNALYNYGCQNIVDAAASLAAAGVPADVNFPAPGSCPDPNGQNGSYGALQVFDWYEEVN